MLVAACGDGAEETTTTAAPEETTTSEAPDETTTTETEPTTTEGEAGGEGALIGFSQPLPNPAIDFIRGIVEQQAAADGNEVTSAVANLDPNKQISDIDSMLQQGIDVLVAYPVDTNAVQPVLQRAREAGIPIIVVDTTGEGPWDTAVVTGNYEAAKLAGDYIAGLLGSGAGIGIIEGPPFAQTLIDRNTGFADAAEEGGLEVLGIQVGDPQGPDAARQIADAWSLEFGSDLAGILAFSDVNALGAASAVGEGFEPTIVGVNGEPSAIEAIQAGRMAGTADVQPVAVGSAVYYAVAEALAGNELPAQIDIPPVMVTPDNVGEWRPWEEQLASGWQVTLEVEGDTAIVNTDGLTFPE